MKRCAVPLLLLATISRLIAQQIPQGPFSPDQWPASADPKKKVHFVSVANAFPPLGDSWLNNMRIPNDGDQTTSTIRIGGFTGVKATANYLNAADPDYAEWADDE